MILSSVRLVNRTCQHDRVRVYSRSISGKNREQKKRLSDYVCDAPLQFMIRPEYTMACRRYNHRPAASAFSENTHPHSYDLRDGKSNKFMIGSRDKRTTYGSYGPIDLELGGSLRSADTQHVEHSDFFSVRLLWILDRCLSCCPCPAFMWLQTRWRRLIVKTRRSAAVDLDVDFNQEPVAL